METNHTIKFENDNNTLIITGVFQFLTVLEINELLQPFIQQIHSENESQPLTLHLEGMKYGSSSLITALARIVLKAKREGVDLEVKIKDVPWQKNFISDVIGLNEKLIVTES